jgi:hypothetical protein
MTSRLAHWRTLPSEHKDYMLIYAWGFFWVLSYVIFTPTNTFTLLNQLIIWFWCVASATGAVIAFIGLVFRDNLLLERFGVHLLMIAPAMFALTQTGLVIYGLLYPDNGVIDASQRIHLIFLGVWPFLFLNKRRRILKKRVIIARATPLEYENEKGS